MQNNKIELSNVEKENIQTTIKQIKEVFSNIEKQNQTLIQEALQNITIQTKNVFVFKDILKIELPKLEFEFKPIDSNLTEIKYKPTTGILENK